MNNTPSSNRLTVAIYGSCNAGKSSLFNAITESKNALVSPEPGTTTDPVIKSMELLPHGPITLIDTAGLGDEGSLGGERFKKTKEILARTDIALYAVDVKEPKWDIYKQFQNEFEARGIPYLVVLTKGQEEKAAVTAAQKQVPEAVIASSYNKNEIEALRRILAKQLDSLLEEEQYLVKGLIPAGACVVLVVPIDSEAPKGRLILPQVQLIRECLDNGIRCHVTTEKELLQALAELSRIDLVVTDSQIFGQVNDMISEHIPLTSFSILMARQKCELAPLEQGAQAIKRLQDGDRVLIAETCTHNRSHEDVGRVKIPTLLQKKTGKKLQFDFSVGRDYPESLAAYALVVHCAGCMITPREMKGRLQAAQSCGVPITNYGMAIAACTGILTRSMEILHDKGGV